MLFANIDDGYLEGYLRGYRAGILTDADYVNLRQCETIDGLRDAALAPCPPAPGTYVPLRARPPQT